ncbi:MAG: hypothetical protein ABI759_01170 [Candidatus Solibacter sp.]
MKHYAIDQWADFTRGLLPDAVRAEMQQHQATGCPTCRELAEFTSKLTETCVSMAQDQVPESMVRLARAIFPVRTAQRPRRGSRLPIELVFDSFLMPAAVGLRSTWQMGWQGLYRAGECSVDVRIEPELKSQRAAVIGQITNHIKPESEMGNLPVSLRAGKQVVAETVSNRFGEFQMEYEQQSKLQLCIGLRDLKVIQVPLKQFTEDRPAARRRTSPNKRSAEQR